VEGNCEQGYVSFVVILSAGWIIVQVCGGVPIGKSFDFLRDYVFVLVIVSVDW
jgi:hypothetical protein